MPLDPDPALDAAIQKIKDDGDILHTVVHGDENTTVTLEDMSTLKSLRNILQSNALIGSTLENDDESTTFHLKDGGDGGEATLNNDLLITGGVVKIDGNEVFHSANMGDGSGLDADELDGQEGSFYRNASNINAGTLPTARLSGTYPISISGNADASNLNAGTVPVARLSGTYNIDISGTADDADNLGGVAAASYLTSADQSVLKIHTHEISGAKATSSISNTTAYSDTITLGTDGEAVPDGSFTYTPAANDSILNIRVDCPMLDNNNSNSEVMGLYLRFQQGATDALVGVAAATESRNIPIHFTGVRTLASDSNITFTLYAICNASRIMYLNRTRGDATVFNDEITTTITVTEYAS